MMGIIPSIEMVLWVALGGRGTLIGPVLGAILVNWAKTTFSESYPDIWLYFLGLMFVIVVVFLPDGLMGLFKKFQKRWSGLHDKQPNSAGVEKNYS
jgi:urea transport system permease protein